jgi:hypothetical protein
MKTFSHLWQYLAEFFLKWEMFQIKVIEKVKTRILCSVASFRKSHSLWDNFEIFVGDREFLDEWRLVAYGINKNTRLQAHTCCFRSPTHPHARTHRYEHALTRARALTHTHTHRDISKTGFSRQLFRECNSILRYTCIASCVINNTG